MSLFALPVKAHLSAYRLHGWDWSGALLTTSGLAVFLVISRPGAGHTTVKPLVWVVVLCAGSALAAGGLAWNDLERFLSLRDEFYQIDTRFGQIGPRGIFTALDRRGVLDHKVAAVDGVEAAMREPP